MIEINTIARTAPDHRIPLWTAWSDDRVIVDSRGFVMAVGVRVDDGLYLTDTLASRAKGRDVGSVAIGDQIKVDGVVYEITKSQGTYPLIRV